MAQHGSPDSWLYVDGFNLGTYLFELADDKEGVLEETTTLGASWPTSAGTGVRKLAVSTSGLYDDDANASNAALSGLQATSRTLCYGVEGQTAGKRFVGAEGAFGGKYARKASRNQLHKGAATWTVSGQVDEGVILQPLATKTATWNTEGAESVDNAASSANGGTAFAQVTAYSGFTSVTLKIRHSADDSTYADLMTLTAVTAAPAARRQTVAGTVNRHLAMSGTVSGSGSITVWVGFARG